MKTRAGFLFVLLLVGIAAFGNFIKSIPFQVVDFDSFQYLTLSRSLLSGTEIYIAPIRSPILSLVIPSSLLAARFLMVLFHIGTALLLYALSFRLFRNRLLALFTALSYGLSWWMLIFQTSPLSDLPGIFLFLLGFFFWLNGDKRSVFASGILFGIAFLLRFDLVFLVFPLALFTKREYLVRLLVPFLIIAFPLELLLDTLAYGRVVYAPFEFFSVNVLQFGGASSKDFLRVASILLSTFPLLIFLSLFVLAQLSRRENRILLSMFMPFFLLASYAQPLEPRIFVVKLLPLLALLSVNFFMALQQILSKQEVWRAVVLGFLVFVVGLGAFRAVGIRYESRKFVAQDCVLQGRVCSNFISAVEYYCNVRAQPAEPTLSSVGEMGKACDSFVYFRDISFYDKGVNAYLWQNAELSAENSAAYVYRLK